MLIRQRQCVVVLLLVMTGVGMTIVSATARSTDCLPAAESQMISPALDKVFAEPGFGYTICYPADWTVTRSHGYAVVFGGKPETAHAFVTVSLDNRLSPRPGEPRHGAAAIASQYVQEVKVRAATQQVESPLPFPYKKNGVFLEGTQVTATFDGKVERLRQWVVAVPRRSGTVVHIWIFSASMADFDHALPVARAMLDSWLISATDQ
ncbi:MAG: hypothetical protein FD153_1553 [Rhodospirillaceae bacterium]|nr:MAG: hypothetical protein FD153_1553 [Rhodospirillaceae bacterium]